MDKPETTPDRPIRVAFLIDNLGVAGTEQWLVRLINGLDRSQVEPFLCLLDGENETSRNQEPSNISIQRLGLRSFRNPVLLLRASRKFVRFLRQNYIDVVQLHFPDSTLFGAPLARWAGVQNVLSTSRNTGYWLTQKLKRHLRRAHRSVTATIANSNASKQAAVDAFGLRPETVSVIPNGVHLSRFNNVLPAKTDVPNGRPWRIGMVANLREVKDIPTFIRAAALVRTSIPNVEFLVAGEGPQRPELESLVAASGMQDRFHILGTSKNIPQFLGTLDVAVLCSQSEGCSNSLLEYMASGRPIVATATGGNLDLIDDGCNGVLVPVGNPEALANAIVRLLNDYSAACSMAASALKMVHEHRRQDQEHRSYCEFYQRLVAQASANGKTGSPSLPSSIR